MILRRVNRSKKLKIVKDLGNKGLYSLNCLLAACKCQHNLDVMYIEKNICVNVIGTLLHIPGKSKDHTKAHRFGGLRYRKTPSALYFR